MSTWTPLDLYVYSVCLASVAAFGALLISDRPITARSIAAAVIFHGAVGGALGGMTYEIFGGKYPWRVLGLATFYGAGYVRITDLAERIIQRAASDKTP